MVFLTAKPRSLFSFDYDLFGKDQSCVRIETSFFWEKGSFEWENKVFTLERKGFFSTHFFLKCQEEIIAQAVKTPFFREFSIEIGKDKYHLFAEKPRFRRFILWENRIKVGSIMPNNCFSRQYKIELPDDLDFLGQIFIVWIVLMVNRRKSY